MSKLRSVKVSGLFGYVDHLVTVAPEAPTVITGPNGTGKTHVLRLIDASLNTDVRYLLEAPFESMILDFADGSCIEISRATEPGADVLPKDLGRPRDNVRLRLAFQDQHGRAFDVETTTAEFEREKSGASRDFPAWVIQLASGRYYDTRAERLLPPRLVDARYGELGRHVPLESSARGRAYLKSIDELKSVLIDTKRLDSELDSLTRPGDRKTSEGEERILGYIREIQAEVAAAREDSLHRSQSADLRFADRALAAATLTVRLDDLKRQYAEVLNLYEEMARNGLAPDETPTGLPEKPNPTAKRIMALLLADWNRRLAPLAPINQKLIDLRSILDSKLQSSGKRTVMGPRGRLGIESTSGRRIPVARLSSGEQHLLAIFSQLLFATKPGSVVLVDEPEISMHMKWQHSFLADVRKVAATSDLQVIIATHSTGIINGRWDFVQELLLPESTESVLDLEGEEDLLGKDSDDDE